MSTTEDHTAGEAVGTGTKTLGEIYWDGYLEGIELPEGASPFGFALLDEDTQAAVERGAQAVAAYEALHDSGPTEAHERAMAAEQALRSILAATPVSRPATVEECEFILATARNALAGTVPGTGQSTEWVVFWGGQSPDESAGWDAYDGEADAGEHREWIAGGGVACRTITYGPWTVTVPPPPPLPGLTEEEREELREWREEKKRRAAALADAASTSGADL